MLLKLFGCWGVSNLVYSLHVSRHGIYFHSSAESIAIRAPLGETVGYWNTDRLLATVGVLIGLLGLVPIFRDASNELRIRYVVALALFIGYFLCPLQFWKRATVFDNLYEEGVEVFN